MTQLESKCMPALKSPSAFFLGAFFLCCCANIPNLCAQTSGSLQQDSATIRGTVVNSLTHEPLDRALVYSPDHRFATMTDDRGRFEFKLPRPESDQASLSVQNDSSIRPSSLRARKMGYLEDGFDLQPPPQGSTEQDLTISLEPEALILGHVLFPSSNAAERIPVELYRRQVREGSAHWDSVGTVMSRSDGEFRFAELQAGSYKLVTHEQLDRDPLTFDPRGQLYGYPPVYYPSAPDFAMASVIQLTVGATFQANISPARREYYTVKMKVTNAPAEPGIAISVSPQGDLSPGYSLAYNANDQLIQGALPDGNYVVRASVYGPAGMTGVSNITVGGAVVEGRALTLLPNTSIAVHVQEQLQHKEPATEGPSTFDGISRLDAQSVKRPNYLNVALQPVEEFGFASGASLRPPANPDDDSPLTIENVQPGRYRVFVSSSIGFAASVTSGATDLLRQPLVVAPGGATPPIEITVRDDGAEIYGVVEATPTNEEPKGGVSSAGQLQSYVYFLPLPGSTGQLRTAWVALDGKFQLQQLPPGAYRVLAFDREQPDLEYASEEAISKYDSKALMITVLAGQKQSLRLPLITHGE